MRTRKPKPTSRHPRTQTIDPNIIERSVLYFSVAELLDPEPMRRPATLTPRADARKRAP
jgi:hypothetical protein